MAKVSSGILGSYRQLFAEPVPRQLAAADICARLPQGMLSITLLLVVAQHASMKVAGLALAGYTLGLAVTAPVRGRLADRHGIPRAAAICCGCFAVALLGLLLSSLRHQSTALLVTFATAAGCFTPPLSPGLRSLWSLHAPARLLQTAFALDAAVFDLAYITGPVLASSLAVGIAPAAALGLMLALTGGGVVLISTTHSPRGNATGAGGSILAPLRSVSLRELLIIAALTNVALTATEVALTAYARFHHVLWASGPLLAEISIGSILGSLLLGTRSPDRSIHQRLFRLLAVYAIGLAGLTAAGLYAPLLALAAPLAGLCLGPTLATLFTAAAVAAPQGGSTETQSWINSIMNCGAAGGAALAGLTADQPLLGLALAAVAAVAAAMTAAMIKAGRKEPIHTRYTRPHHRLTPARRVRQFGSASRPCKGGNPHQ